MTTNPLFDIENASDLPFAVGHKESIQEKIIKLLAMADNPVTIDQIRAAYYRKHGVAMAKNQVSARLSVAVKVGQVKRGPERTFLFVKQIGGE